MLKLPLVSFIVTSFNYQEFIDDTLESIKLQDYSNFEIIIVDDASKDNSVDIIEKFIQFNQDLRITLIKHEKNLGQLASMLDGLKIARGQFVSFIDSDDILLKEYAKTHIRVHLSSSVAFTSSQIVEIDQDNIIHTTYSVASAQKSLPQEIKTLDDLLAVDYENIEFSQLTNWKFGGWYWAPNSSAMYRKSALQIALYYKNPEKWRVCPDKFLFNLCCLIGGSINIYAPLIAYRRHKSNAGSSNYVCGDTKYNDNKTTLQNINNTIKIRPEIFKFLIENRKNFIEDFGLKGYIRLILKVMFR